MHLEGACKIGRTIKMACKFEDLEVWTRALDYSDQVHDIAQRLPKHERYNLADQITRAANNRLCLNVASS